MWKFINLGNIIARKNENFRNLQFTIRILTQNNLQTYKFPINFWYYEKAVEKSSQFSKSAHWKNLNQMACHCLIVGLSLTTSNLRF
jgi:hypothetical protein